MDVTDSTNSVDGTVIHFCLPQGYRDPTGVWHREGILRAALAGAEIRAQSDFRVCLRPESLLDILLARMSGQEPEPFWDGWSRLRAEYEKRFSA